MKVSGVYRIVNTDNGKIYIGSSTDIKRRWNNHKRRLNQGMHTNSHLQRAWNKYGEEAFEFQIIEQVEEQGELIEIEQSYMDYYSPEYNIAPEAGVGSGFAEETLKKFSEIRSGEGNPMYGKTGKEHPAYGRTHTEEAKRKISKANSGKGNGMYGKAPWKGKTRDKETREKISQTLKGKYSGLEHPGSKLSEKQIRIIKHLIKGGNFSQAQIGKMFGVYQTSISRIKLGKSYSNIKI